MNNKLPRILFKSFYEEIYNNKYYNNLMYMYGRSWQIRKANKNGKRELVFLVHFFCNIIYSKIKNIIKLICKKDIIIGDTLRGEKFAYMLYF